ncbi:MAG: S8 family serine peptidase [Candidatus Brocadia sp.]|nr:S8 family serine peptidase [Candidatus Brocadia sp.]
MKKAIRVTIQYFSGTLVTTALCIAFANAGGGSDFVTDELLIQPKARVSDRELDALCKNHNATVIDSIPQIHVKLLKVSPHDRERVKSALSGDSNISFVENNFTAVGSFIPNDTYYSSQWHLARINAPMGWDISTGEGNVPIAIIDSGVDPSHPDLSAKLLPGYNYLDSTTNTADVLGHGTAVAGSAAALSDNTTGVAGVAWNNPVMPLVVLNSSNFASYSDIAKAIMYAADQGVRVINISIGGSGISSTLQNAVDYAWNKGSVIFASAMNNSSNTPYYPAACNNVVAVSATTSSDTIASFSNYGDWIDISAPGSSIITTNNGGGYGDWSGTSFSSPLSAGLAALILSINPSLTNTQVVSIMENNADDLGNPGFDSYYGYGRINVYKSLTAAKNSETQTDTISPVVSVMSPGNNAYVKNFQKITVIATDSISVSAIELYIDGILMKSVTDQAILSYRWNTRKVAGGPHGVSAKAYDAAGNMNTDAITVYK